MKYALCFLAFVCLALANSQATMSESDEVAIKEHLIKLETQSWEAWKNRDGKFFQDFFLQKITSK
jgi:hypothetical protein